MRFLPAAFFVLCLSTVTLACFENAAVLTKYSFGKYVNSKELKFSPAVQNFCKETQYKDNFKKLAANEILAVKPHLKLKLLIEAQSVAFKVVYQEQSEKIKKIDALDERLRAAYLFAVSNFGFLEFDRKKFTSEPEFENIKNLSDLKIEFLAYVLTQTKRAATDYNVKILQSYPMDGMKSRQWVRIEISDKENQKLDLDPTVTGLQYLPLPQRHTGINETDSLVLQEECDIAVNCLIGMK